MLYSVSEQSDLVTNNVEEGGGTNKAHVIVSLTESSPYFQQLNGLQGDFNWPPLKQRNHTNHRKRCHSKVASLARAPPRHRCENTKLSRPGFSPDFPDHHPRRNSTPFCPFWLSSTSRYFRNRSRHSAHFLHLRHNANGQTLIAPYEVPISQKY